ncbi:MAG: F0F1 ATP synthase subunit A [Clostridium sp.]
MEDLVIWSLNFLGRDLHITLSMLLQVIVSLVIISVAFYFTRNLKKIPNKKQSMVELFIVGLNNIIKENMGDTYFGFAPFIGTLALYLGTLNLVGLFGISPPTTDFSVTFGLGLISFIVIQGYTIKKIGLLHYFGGYAKPIALLLPINIMERIVFPISLALRLFGNMFAATMIMDLLYGALAKVSIFAQFGVPIALHAYFDIFDGTLQMVIFVMLTMINIKIISEH